MVYPVCLKYFLGIVLCKAASDIICIERSDFDKSLDLCLFKFKLLDHLFTLLLRNLKPPVTCPATPFSKADLCSKTGILLCLRTVKVL